MRISSMELTVLAVLCLCGSAVAQSTLDWPLGEMEPYYQDSGKLTSVSADTDVVYSTSVTIEDAVWMRLYFESIELEAGSRIRMTSAFDGEVQELDAEGMAMWSNTSAYFNGDTVYVDVIATPGTTKNRMILQQVSRYVAPGIDLCGATGCGYCGPDNRVPSDEEWTGRLMPVGCTASVYNDQSCLVSAGHCVDDGFAQVIQFRVPDSDPDCFPNQPTVSNQFPITDEAFQNNGPGDDWAALLAGTNDLGQTIYERYGEFRPISSGIVTGGAPIAVWGYGVDGQPERSQVQQTASGTVYQRFSDRYYISVDITYGNSGSSVIWNDQIIGIVSHCPCPNVATRIDNNDFENAREDLCPFVLSYCDASSSSSSNEYISNVTVGDIDNDSSRSQYSDFTAQNTRMAIGTDHELSVSIGDARTSDVGGVWVDWNRDGEFTGPGEDVETSWSGTGPYTATLSPPTGSSVGATRMRVRVQRNTIDPTPEPCGTTSRGEVEDYTIIIDPAPPTCDDGIRNQNESRIDCGGPCPPCDCTSDGQCSNGVYCDGPEFCDDHGECQQGPGIECDDGIECTADACNEDTGQCDHAPDDNVCDNGIYCDGQESCSLEEGCMPGTPVNCSDLVTCTIDACVEETQSCQNTPDDSFCDDAIYCNGAETCDPVAGCTDGEAVQCDDGIDCTLDLCYEPTDECISLPDDNLCDDGLACNGIETCNAAAGCEAGTPVDCDDGVDCTVDSCLEPGGECSNSTDHASCDDGSFCNGQEQCDPDVGCVSGEEPCPIDFWCHEATQSCESFGSGDLDGDGDVDLADCGLFQQCYGESVPGPCSEANLAGGDTINLNDYILFAGQLDQSGPQ